MTGRHSIGTLFEPRIRPGLRLGLTLIITLIVMSSPIFILVNPASAKTSMPLPTISASPSAPSTISQSGKDGDFTTQAALSSLTARPTNNIVNTNSFYDVVFLTAISGPIKFIQVTFPAGTTIPSGAFFNEAEGIGPGTASKSGQTITYTVANAVNVPAGTKIRLEFANINNPLQVSSNYKVTVTTRTAETFIIDGPSQSTAYTIKQIGTNAIADNSITSTKPAESFMKRVSLLDNPAGNALGWDPDGVKTLFTLTGEFISPDIMITIMVINVANTNHFCDVVRADGAVQFFRIACSSPPPNGVQLEYLIQNVPNQDF